MHRLCWAAAIFIHVLVVFVLATPLRADDDENTNWSYGHGSFIAPDGTSAKVDDEFLKRLQQSYLKQSLSVLPKAKQEEFARLQEALAPLSAENPDDAFHANAALLDWAIATFGTDPAGRTLSMNSALRGHYTRQYHNATGNTAPPMREPSKALTELLRELGLGQARGLQLATINGGAAYTAQCDRAGVPIPPTWDGFLPNSPWRSLGILTNDQEFISQSFEAEVFINVQPRGVCVALPRSSIFGIQLLGIICQSKATGKVCFWDNQVKDPVSGFGRSRAIQKWERKGIDQFLGGADLFGGEGSVCTGCHAGHNPFIVHPTSPLGLIPDRNSPVFYDPIVDGRWPQNLGPTRILDPGPFDPPRTPPRPSTELACTSCHSTTGGAMGFPVLFGVPNVSPPPPIVGNFYCGILEAAINRTMPSVHPPGIDARYASDIAVLRQACGRLLPDRDSDAVTDELDNCPDLATADRADWNANGLGDRCEDTDRDSKLDFEDNCRTLYNPGQADWDNDRSGDVCDDFDGDRVTDDRDNCISTRNADQDDFPDNDGIGTACDADADDDGICYPPGPVFASTLGVPRPGGCPANADNCPVHANARQTDSDNDGFGDSCDSCPSAGNVGDYPDRDGVDNSCDVDDDNDNVPDVSDNCPLLASPDQSDWNNNGIGHPCDPDEQVAVGTVPIDREFLIRMRNREFDRYSIVLLPELPGPFPRPHMAVLSVEASDPIEMRIVTKDGVLAATKEPGKSVSLSFEVPLNSYQQPPRLEEKLSEDPISRERVLPELEILPVEPFKPDQSIRVQIKGFLQPIKN